MHHANGLSGSCRRAGAGLCAVVITALLSVGCAPNSPAAKGADRGGIASGLPSAGEPPREPTDASACTRTSAPRWPELGSLYATLRRLEGGSRKLPVRVAWFGDSHTAADFLTGAMRSRLQDAFGNGGPGFVNVGVGMTRHDDVRVKSSGGWERKPESPTAFYLQDDGVFGLGGLRARATHGALSLRSTDDRAQALRWELVVRPVGRNASVRVADASGELVQLRFQEQAAAAALSDRLRLRGSQLLAVPFAPRGAGPVDITANDVEMFGAFAEYPRPGVVLDAMGINGARIRTMLAWQEGSWLGEVSERDPALVVLAYGSNEAGDQVAVERYAEDYRAVLARLRAAAPGVNCLLIGPTDRGKGQEQAARRAQRIDEMQRDVAAELGCAKYSVYDVMGGAGGFSAWARQKPALASADGVHLTASGYRKLGDLLADDLLEDYSASACAE